MEPTDRILEGAHVLTKDVFVPNFTGLYPYEFSTPEEELNAARETAWIGIYLEASPDQRISGPDAVKLLNLLFVNRDFGTMRVGSSRHTISVNERGQVTDSSLTCKIGENEFWTTSTSMLMMFQALKDQHGLDVTQTLAPAYFIQIDGPKSLEILEEAAKTDLHDIRFGQNRWINIEGREVFLHRLGMSGCLAYEIHGAVEDREFMYDLICTIGEKYGAKRQGIRTYCCNHTPGSNPNQFIHFGYPDPFAGNMIFGLPLSGSCAAGLDDYFVNPWDFGCGKIVNFDHDFIGKAALEKIAAGPKRVPVTLEWDPASVGAVLAAEISGTVDEHEGILDFDRYVPEFHRVHMDQVLAGGRKVGVTGGRVRDYWHKTFISMAFIDEAKAIEGSEVTVLWGKPGERQMEVKATIARFPYFSGEWRNETCDVMSLVPRRYA